MLFKLNIEYNDGRIEETIIYRDKGDEVTIYPREENIKHAGCKPFKYEVEKHMLLPKMIITLKGKTYIYPSRIQCHPNTTLDDIIEIQPQTQMLAEERIEQPKTQEKKSWRFESSSGGGIYTVKQTKTGKLICDCPGVWRSKDRRCKHIKEVETY